MSLPAALFAPPFAHRGLWRPDGPPENSLAAFDAACIAGYGIELDVFLSADGEAVVFHDDDLERMTGAPGKVWDRTAAELGALALKGGPERIPTLKHTLDVVAGRAMLLVEIKAGPGLGGPLETRVAELLDDYWGAAAVISFAAGPLAWFARHRPDRLRGLDAMTLAADDLAASPQAESAFENACALAEPHFLALQLDTAAGPLAARFRANGRPVVAWTVRSAADAAKVAPCSDNFIFEGFTA